MKTSKLIGQQIGPFKVLSTIRTEIPSGNKITKYKCECVKCGAISYKQLHHLKQFKGEGCLECTEKLTAQPRISMEYRNYTNYKYKIKNQTDKEFNMTFEEFDYITNQNCHYCGQEPTFPERFKNEFKNRDIVLFNGIDRVNSSKGYSLDNCVPCCTKCNIMKLNLDVNDFLNHVKKIYEFNQSSTTSHNDVAPSGCEMEEVLTDKAEDQDIVSSIQ